MVAPLDNVRPVGTPAPASAPRTQPVGADFAAELQRATEQLAATEKPPALPFDADPLLEIEQATKSMQRATSYINSARAYYRAAQPGESSLDLRS